MSAKYVNLACGSVFINSDVWMNFDFAPTYGVQQANLLGRLPLQANTTRLVYSSHFLEHIPRSRVDAFLTECFRILQSGGVIRLVLPDFQELAQTYLNLRNAGKNECANFLVIEIVDQCVRHESGGELQKFYRRLMEVGNQQNEMIGFIYERTGEDLSIEHCNQKNIGFKRILIRAIRGLLNCIYRLRIRISLSLLPSEFRLQNVSLADVGECHQWLWDFYQLKQSLERAGFTKVTRLSADASLITDFPFYPLDLNLDGKPRKGSESMYVEAIKP